MSSSESLDGEGTADLFSLFTELSFFFLLWKISNIHKSRGNDIRNPHVPITLHQQFLIYGPSCSPSYRLSPHCFDVNPSYGSTSSGKSKDIFTNRIACINITQVFVEMQIFEPQTS